MFGQRGIRLAQKATPSFAEIHFDVTPSIGKSLLGMFFFLGCGLIFVDMGSEHRGLIINHLIRFDAAEASTFYIVLAILSLCMALLAGLGLVRSFGEKVWLVLGSSSIFGPKSYNGNQIIEIRYDDVKNIERTRVSNHEFVVITSRDGKKIRIGSGNFRQSDQWANFTLELRRRINFQF
jgi:hypothetical protein